MLLADEFVDSVTQFSAKLAKHRGGDRVEAKDVELHLAKAYNIKIPGITDASLSKPPVPTASSNPAHQSRLEAVMKSKKI